MLSDTLHEATLYKALDDGTLVCQACKLYCKIRPGQIGICGVRVNREGKLFFLIYGKASAVQIDPMEKKPLFHFLPGKAVFSLGTVGCNFGCSFCQNWDLSQAARDLRKRLMKEKRERDIDLELTPFGYKLPPEKIVSTCLKKSIPAIAYTYNEPAIFFEYLYDTAVLAHAQGIRNVFVSNGYESVELMEKMDGLLDAMNIDLKSFSNTFYTKICRAQLQPVLDTIRHAWAMGIWLEITTLVIPGKNDSKRELTQIAEFIASVSPDIPWHISAFRPDHKMRDVSATSHRLLRKTYDIGKKAGLKHVYIGNMPDEKRTATYCTACGNTLINRWGYQIWIDPDFENGCCPHCKTKIAGIWNT